MAPPLELLAEDRESWGVGAFYHRTNRREEKSNRAPFLHDNLASWFISHSVELILLLGQGTPESTGPLRLPCALQTPHLLFRHLDGRQTHPCTPTLQSLPQGRSGLLCLLLSSSRHTAVGLPITQEEQCLKPAEKPSQPDTGLCWRCGGKGERRGTRADPPVRSPRSESKRCFLAHGIWNLIMKTAAATTYKHQLDD